MQAKKTKNRNCLPPKSHRGLHVLRFQNNTHAGRTTQKGLDTTSKPFFIIFECLSC